MESFQIFNYILDYDTTAWTKKLFKDLWENETVRVISSGSKIQLYTIFGNSGASENLSGKWHCYLCIQIFQKTDRNSQNHGKTSFGKLHSNEVHQTQD